MLTGPFVCDTVRAHIDPLPDGLLDLPLFGWRQTLFVERCLLVLRRACRPVGSALV